MRNAKRKIFMIVLLCAGFISVASAEITEQAPKEQQPSTWELIRKAQQKQTDSKPGEFSKASELLSKYTETQDKLRSSFISKIEVSAKFEGFLKARPTMKRCEVYEQNRKIEIRSDGKRVYSRQKIWGRRSIGTTTEENANVNHRLWDSKALYYYSHSPLSRSNKLGTVDLSYPDPKNTSYLWQWQHAPGQALRGYFTGERVRIDSELRHAKTISVEPQREDINGAKCYIINAKTEDCEYRIWIDPEHDYNIAKAIVKRNWASYSRPEGYSKRPPQGHSEIELHSVRFKKIDDTWLPVEGDYRRENEYVTGEYGKEYTHMKITDFVLNPDHDALGSFETDFIRNGSRVQIIGLQGIRYRWQDGKVVDANGKIIEEFQKKASEGGNNNAKQ